MSYQRGLTLLELIALSKEVLASIGHTVKVGAL